MTKGAQDRAGGTSGSALGELCPFAVAREKKKVPAVPETLKKKRRNFAELKIKRLRKKFAQKMVRQLFCKALAMSEVALGSKTNEEGVLRRL